MKKINKKILAISFTPKIKIAIQTALATSENVFSKKILFTAGEFCKGEIKISIIVANKVKFTKKENRFFKFLRGTKSELKKIVWPTWKQTLNKTLIVCGVVVLFAVLIVHNLHSHCFCPDFKIKRVICHNQFRISASLS